MSSVRALLEACISPYISGSEMTAFLDAMEVEGQRLEDFRVSTLNQLYISTASDNWLKMRAGDVGFSQPEDLGLADFIFRKLTIDTWNVKQVTTIIHEVLETFYGADATRAYLQSVTEPYQLQEGMQLLFDVDGKAIVYEVIASDYPVGGLASAKAADVAAAMTRSFRTQGLNMFADEYIDAETGARSVRVFSGAIGPVGYIRINGGEMEIPMGFETLIENVQDPGAVVTWTNWQITRRGNNLRYTWGGNQDPGLDTLKIGDEALIYGSGFNNVGVAGTDLRGSFPIVAVVPDVVGTSYFEILCPTPVVGGSEIISVNQGNYNSLRFQRPKTMRANFRKRYALAWEPTKELLKIYLPATTRVIERGIIGAAHLKYGISTADLEGSFGSLIVDSQRVSVLNDYALSWASPGYDNWAFGGTLTFEAWDSGQTYFLNQIVSFGGLQYQSLQNTNLANTPDMTPLWWKAVDTSLQYAKREAGMTTVVMKIPHGVRSLASMNYPAFNSANSYAIGDIADYSGFLYVAIAPNPAASSSPLNSNFWALYTDDTKKSNAFVTLSAVPIITDEVPTFPSSYIYDPGSGYVLTSKSVVLAQQIRAGESYRDVLATGIVAAGIPDNAGYVILDLNRDTQEVVPIIGSTTGSIVFDPSYRLKYTHDSGSDISLLSSNYFVSSPDGSDRGTYVTGTYLAREYCQYILDKIVALGIKLEIVIVYPSDYGWGGAGNDTRTDYVNTEANPTIDVQDEKHSDVVWIYGA